MHVYVMSDGDDYKACFPIPPDQNQFDLNNLKEEITKLVCSEAEVNFCHSMKPYDSYGSECYVRFCKKARLN